jgi:hypothetical protein
VIGRSVRTRLGGVLGRQGHSVHVARSRICYQRRPHNLGMPQNLNLRIPASAAWFAVCLAIATAGGRVVVSS